MHQKGQSSNSSNYSIWNDLNQDQYFLINNINGTSQQVNKNGDYIKKFNMELTGKASFKERQNTADACYRPYEAKSLKAKPEFYIPQPDKFDGYTQIPRPKVQQYFNQRPNTTPKQGTEQLTYITGTAKDFFYAQENNKIEVLAERKQTRQREFSAKKNTIKMINGKTLPIPRLSKYQAYKAVDIQTNHSPEVTAQKPSLSPTRPVTQMSNQYTTQHTNITPINQNDLQSLKALSLFLDSGDMKLDRTKTSKYSCMTFFHDKKQEFNQKTQTYSSLKTEKQYLNELSLQQQQMNSFLLPVVKEKDHLCSKGRFNVKIQTNQELYSKGRSIMMTLYPELYKNRENPKKIELEKQRKILNKVKEKEMLDRNLKNKV